MNKKIAMATIAFVLLCMVLGVAVQAAADALGAPGPLAGQVATFVVAIPLALLLSRRVGHLTHPSLLVASAVVAVASLWGTVFILNAIAEPAGGHVGWESLFNPMNWRNTVFGAKRLSGDHRHHGDASVSQVSWPLAPDIERLAARTRTTSVSMPTGSTSKLTNGARTAPPAFRVKT